MHATGGSVEAGCPLFISSLYYCSPLTFSVIQLLNNSFPLLHLSLMHTHTHTCSVLTPASYLSASHPPCCDHHGESGAVESCSQSLHYSAPSECPSLCVSTACLNYSLHGHYRERSHPPLRSTPKKNPIRMRQVVCKDGGGTLLCLFTTVE